MDMTPDGIKLDRSLVLQMNKGECHRNLIKDALVSAMQQTGCFIVAEGVETAEMAEVVLGCNISIIQGFYFAKPMPEHELAGWYKRTERQKAPNSLGK
jgi:diguanylate cyclase